MAENCTHCKYLLLLLMLLLPLLLVLLLNQPLIISSSKTLHICTSQYQPLNVQRVKRGEPVIISIWHETNA